MVVMMLKKALRVLQLVKSTAERSVHELKGSIDQ